jgi:hypothetical protein
MKGQTFNGILMAPLFVQIETILENLFAPGDKSRGAFESDDLGCIESAPDCFVEQADAKLGVESANPFDHPQIPGVRMPQRRYELCLCQSTH